MRLRRHVADAWALPQPAAERPPPYDPGALLATNHDHTDAIWALDMHEDETTLLSAGADAGARYDLGRTSV